jgi:hypothetical protein
MDPAVTTVTRTLAQLPGELVALVFSWLNQADHGALAKTDAHTRRCSMLPTATPAGSLMYREPPLVSRAGQRASQRSSPPGEAAQRAQQPHGQHSSPSGRSRPAGGVRRLDCRDVGVSVGIGGAPFSGTFADKHPTAVAFHPDVRITRARLGQLARFARMTLLLLGRAQCADIRSLLVLTDDVPALTQVRHAEIRNAFDGDWPDWVLAVLPNLVSARVAWSPHRPTQALPVTVKRLVMGEARFAPGAFDRDYWLALPQLTDLTLDVDCLYSFGNAIRIANLLPLLRRLALKAPAQVGFYRGWTSRPRFAAWASPQSAAAATAVAVARQVVPSEGRLTVPHVTRLELPASDSDPTKAVSAATGHFTALTRLVLNVVRSETRANHLHDFSALRHHPTLQSVRAIGTSRNTWRIAADSLVHWTLPHGALRNEAVGVSFAIQAARVFIAARVASHNADAAYRAEITADFVAAGVVRVSAAAAAVVVAGVDAPLVPVVVAPDLSVAAAATATDTVSCFTHLPA